MPHWKVGLLLALIAPWGIAHAQPMFADGFEESCFVDSDGDRLSNCEEALRGLDHLAPDTDDDGLKDGDEVLGTPDGLDLSAFGVDPRRKDLLVEYDWQNDNVQPEVCGPHVHKPGPQALEDLRVAFAAMPVPNPDGSTGINLIQDVGQGGVFTGGNAVDVPGATIVGSVDGDHFQAIKLGNFAGERLGYFRYVLNVHAYTLFPDSSGAGELLGDDALITTGCSWSQHYIRNAIMHELGHILSLHHGGDTPCNWKPNYNSVMNYRYQSAGIDINCKLGGDGVMNYSAGARAPLDESHLDEHAGLCDGVAIDWNPQDGGILSDTSKDLNYYSNASNPVQAQTLHCGGIITILTDHDDFAALDFGGLPNGSGGGSPVPTPVVNCDQPSSE